MYPLRIQQSVTVTFHPANDLHETTLYFPNAKEWETYQDVIKLAHEIYKRGERRIESMRLLRHMAKSYKVVATYDGQIREGISLTLASLLTEEGLT